MNRESAAASAKGTIHDQGYQRYEGARLPQTRRFLVIARNVLSVAWRGKWAVKLPVFMGILTLVVASGFMVAFTQLSARLGGRTPGWLQADMVVFNSIVFFQLWGLILTATVATAAIADDLRSGAFQFYFSRPLRSDDYVRGKLLGLLALVGMPMFAGPVGLSIIRVFLTDDLGDALRVMGIVPQAMAIGLIATTALVLPAAGLGALIRKRLPAQVAFAVGYLVVGSIAIGIGEAVELPELGALSIPASIGTLNKAVFTQDLDSGDPPVWAAALVLSVLTIAGYWAIRSRIKSAESAGVGGGS